MFGSKERVLEEHIGYLKAEVGPIRMSALPRELEERIRRGVHDSWAYPRWKGQMSEGWLLRMEIGIRGAARAIRAYNLGYEFTSVTLTQIAQAVDFQRNYLVKESYPHVPDDIRASYREAFQSGLFDHYLITSDLGPDGGVLLLGTVKTASSAPTRDNQQQRESEKALTEGVAFKIAGWANHLEFAQRSQLLGSKPLRRALLLVAKKAS